MTKILTNNSGNDIEVTSIVSTRSPFSIVFSSGPLVPGTPRPPFLLRNRETISLRVRFVPVSARAESGLIRARTRGPNGPVFIFTAEGEGIF